eukprot:TRINITY_DN6088_c0_g1_i1.p1 TRINITY_DN6088_c0_g1~~TRINITY_DN6088_c0_g1_i1.p1  ORF type:complete len:128 (-),score=26.03 TRINITY_DN6088_c0_g1_i1:75-428(-)
MTTGSDVTRYFTCRVCRQKIFDEQELVPHEKSKHSLTLKQTKGIVPKTVECTSYFISEKEWMGELSSIDGKLLCPKCRGRVGSYRWDGAQCSCGTWNRPAFQILKARVDEKVDKYNS